MMRSTIARGAMPVLAALLALTGMRSAAAQTGRITIPADTVVQVRLDESVSSSGARVGDRVTATLQSDDRSGFPQNTRFEGRVTEVQRKTSDRPGILNMRFDRAVLPDGRSVSVDGRLASLSDEDVRRTASGRLEARKRGGNGGFDLKWVGYGAVAGGVLAEIFGSNFLKGALLGGLGGAIYGYLNRDKDRANFREVSLARGTEFGIAMRDRIVFDDRASYRYTARLDRGNPRGDRVAGSREEFRYGSSVVTVDGRQVQFSADARPMNVNGVMYVPLEPVARAGNMRFSHRSGDEMFTLQTRRGLTTGYAGEDSVMIGDSRLNERLSPPPLSIDGEIYVTSEFLSRVADMNAQWDRRGRRLTLTTYR